MRLITTRTPLRISFLGGGTDYPDYFLRYGGQTLGVAIDKYSFVTVRASQNGRARDVDATQPPVVGECLRFLGISASIEIEGAVDLPVCGGLGSSSSFTVGLLHALHLFKGERVSRRQLAGEAVYVEQEMLRERVGVQDQYTCAHGGFVHLTCGPDRLIRLSPVRLRAARLAELRSHLMLFDTGIRRRAHEVLDEQVERTRNGTIAQELALLSRLVDQGLELLCSEEPIICFGELLHAAWMIKRRLSSKISNPKIDSWYDAARRSGAIGGKLLGAGGGGFLLLFAAPERQAAVERTLDDLRRVEVGFDQTGSRQMSDARRQWGGQLAFTDV